MSRVKRGVMTKKRHKRLIKLASGYWGQRKNVFRRAKETVLRALNFAYIGRKLRKRDFRSLFIARVKAAVELRHSKYNVFINNLKKANIKLNRKVLSQVAIFDASGFDFIFKQAMQAA
jgi:large subunit ribosomal protein L20